MAGVTSDALPDEIANALGAMDYEQLGIIAQGINLIAVKSFEDSANYLCLEYIKEGNQDLSKFWQKIGDIMGKIRYDTATSIVERTNTKK